MLKKSKLLSAVHVKSIKQKRKSNEVTPPETVGKSPRVAHNSNKSNCDLDEILESSLRNVPGDGTGIENTKRSKGTAET